MSERIAITGIGIISALGMNVQENLYALKNSESGIGKMSFIKSIHQDEFPVGEVKKTDRELAEYLAIPYERTYTRTSLLAMVAAKEAWLDAGDPLEDKCGLISATTVAGMRTSEENYVDFIAYKEDDFFVEAHDAGDGTEKVADFLNITDFITTISTACSSSANSIMLGARMLKAHKLDRVLVGGVDALSLFTINGFNTLMILDKEACKSFDNKRAGLNLGEAAAYLVLVPEHKLKKTDRVYGFVQGYANANDAFHQTASSPNGMGAALAMEKALKSAAYTASDIDYINAHGTATNNNDLSEGMAIMKVFGQEIPDLSSTKPFTGHTLAAAGAVEAVFSCLAMQNDIRFPNLNFNEQMEELDFSPITTVIKKPVKTVLSNSFGFGGNNSTLIFSKE